MLVPKIILSVTVRQAIPWSGLYSEWSLIFYMQFSIVEAIQRSSLCRLVIDHIFKAFTLLWENMMFGFVKSPRKEDKYFCYHKFDNDVHK